MNKFITLVTILLCAFTGAFSQELNGKLKLKVYTKDCTIRLVFKNKSSTSINIPNYIAMSNDTSNRMVLMPNAIIDIVGDTLVLSSKHTGQFEGNLDTLQSRGLFISDYGSKNSRSKVLLIQNVISLKRVNVQVLRLPTDFCNRKLKYCRIDVDAGTLVVGKVK